MSKNSFVLFLIGFTIIMVSLPGYAYVFKLKDKSTSFHHCLSWSKVTNYNDKNATAWVKNSSRSGVREAANQSKNKYPYFCVRGDTPKSSGQQGSYVAGKIIRANNTMSATYHIYKKKNHEGKRNYTTDRGLYHSAVLPGVALNVDPKVMKLSEIANSVVSLDDAKQLIRELIAVNQGLQTEADALKALFESLQ